MTVKVRGVVRDVDNPRALIAVFDERATDDDMRSFHDYIRDWRRDGSSLRALLKRALPCVESEAAMMDVMDRHAPLPAEDQHVVSGAADRLHALVADIKAALQ